MCLFSILIESFQAMIGYLRVKSYVECWSVRYIVLNNIFFPEQIIELWIQKNMYYRSNFLSIFTKAETFHVSIDFIYVMKGCVNGMEWKLKLGKITYISSSQNAEPCFLDPIHSLLKLISLDYTMKVFCMKPYVLRCLEYCPLSW